MKNDNKNNYYNLILYEFSKNILDENIRLKEQIQLLRNKCFGKKSERLATEDNSQQLSFFDE